MNKFLLADDYQHECARTVGDASLAVLALGLAGEAGEVVDLVKKHIGHGHELDKAKLCAELGDLQWYLAMIALYTGCSLSAVMTENVEKLRRRYPDGFSSEASRNRSE